MAPGRTTRLEPGGTRPLAVTYLLEDTGLYGGVKVVLHQADLLQRRGYRVTVVARGERPGWCAFSARFRQVAAFTPDTVPAADVTVATFWTTIEPALSCATGEVVHLCQGFEGDLTHNRDDHEAIEAAYQHPVPAMTVAPHLAAMLGERFGRPARVVRQPLEPFWRPPLRRRWLLGPRRRPRILVTSPFEFYMKGVPTALQAIRLLRSTGQTCRLVRLSQWPLSEEEKSLLPPDQFHHHLTPRRAAVVLGSCDLLLCPSWASEGFGLTALEAMASGVPVVASDIPCYRDWAAEAAKLVPFDQPQAFAAAAAELLAQPARWRARRSAGLRLAARFSEEKAATSIEQALAWVAAGDWRHEGPS